MKSAFFAIFFSLQLLSCTVFCQEYSYKHYDLTDGLAGSTVYSIAQDKNGFIWVATETGVSQFDGTHFRNFTILDGLPDNEMLQLFGDREGRLWMAPFRNSICYWYKGRIHNQDNDQMLGRIHFRQNIENFAEDKDGDILVQERTALHLVRPDGTVREYDSLDNMPISESAAVCADASGHFRIQVGNRIYGLDANAARLEVKIDFPVVDPNTIAMSATYVVSRESPANSEVFSFATGQRSSLPYARNQHISYGILGDSLLYTGSILGCTEKNLLRGTIRQFLPGKVVSRVFRDADGSLWFSTLGEGIFRLNSDRFTTKEIGGKEGGHSGVMSILRMNGELLVGTDKDKIFGLSLPDLKSIRNIGRMVTAANRILFLDSLNQGQIIIGADNTLTDFSMDGRHNPRAVPTTTKSVQRCRNGKLLIATAWGAGDFDLARWRFEDTLWRGRSTMAYRFGDTVFIGTLNGLYRLDGQSGPEFLGARNILLRTRITAMARAADGIYWIASNGAGIIGWRGDSVVSIINRANGLTSDICRTVTLEGNLLWVGTDLGLNRIELDKPGYPITRYTSNDGLGSNIVNMVLADSPMIYIGTPAGLSYFDPARLGEKEGCRLYFLSLQNGTRDRTADSNQLVIPYADRDIKFSYVGISYRSMGDITYRYRLIGLDSGWRMTKRTDMEYPILPPGSYEFELEAVNKFGIRSDTLHERFLVETPFWLTGWFDFLVVVVLIAATWGLASRRIRAIRRRQLEKDKLARKMTELERMALQAQMNPHFIFNCLTSVQQFIIERDVQSANKYIAGLARLIRMTLHNSSLAFITLGDEVDYLSAYMSLEKLRFKEKMEYSIDVDPALSARSCYLPPMLIQPFVENGIRHGLRHKRSGNGYMRVTINQDAFAGRSGLTVVVEDNGIGREMASKYKTAEHIEYQSKGMSMTTERIRMINTVYGGDIRVEVIDLQGGGNLPSGTRVVIRFTFFNGLDQNDNI